MAKYQLGPCQIPPFTLTNMAVISRDEERLQQSRKAEAAKHTNLNAIFRSQDSRILQLAKIMVR